MAGLWRSKCKPTALQAHNNLHRKSSTIRNKWSLGISEAAEVVVPWWSSLRRSCRGQWGGLAARRPWRPWAGRTVLLECLSTAADSSTCWQNYSDLTTVPCSLIHTSSHTACSVTKTYVVQNYAIQLFICTWTTQCFRISSCMAPLSVCVSVCLSVCLSVTSRCSVETVMVSLD